MAKPTSDLIDRLQNFLPKIEIANRELSSNAEPKLDEKLKTYDDYSASSSDDESDDCSDEEQIELNFQIGDFDRSILAELEGKVQSKRNKK
mmetsp:Transcript_12239/g.18327  ORF Transcript_12239/g.18327 Transcript_12239/m.18327 type:complete len:91 (-) Transcript_12239:11-283(-)